MGGLNLHLAALHSPAAYLSLVHSCSDLISKIIRNPSISCFHPSLHPFVQLVAERAARPHWVTVDDIKVPITQRILSLAINEVTLSKVINDAEDDRSCVLVLSSSTPHAGDWLTAIPSKALGLHMMDTEYRLCPQYWLGLCMFSEGSCPHCSLQVDAFGDHHLSCLGQGGKITRHNALRDIIFTAARMAALSPKLEVPYLLPSSSARPADIYLPLWSSGTPAALDVTVISPMGHSISLQPKFGHDHLRFGRNLVHI